MMDYLEKTQNNQALLEMHLQYLHTTQVECWGIVNKSESTYMNLTQPNRYLIQGLTKCCVSPKSGGKRQGMYGQCSSDIASCKSSIVFSNPNSKETEQPISSNLMNALLAIFQQERKIYRSIGGRIVFSRKFSARHFQQQT